ncbi:4473_t:CDS:1 [Acaulospora colombiana]|uniref:4473_t:CDS:1 n=1 Tax=Acaulospora colombiana TaxID=27376 RepID=A0ACA9LFL7_9GLOM|nr:4473_t:CDS:1 [Acaulospora colombiana]
MAHLLDHALESDNDSLRDSRGSSNNGYYDSTDASATSDEIAYQQFLSILSMDPIIIKRLREMGPEYFGNRESAFAELQIKALGRPDSTPQSFYVHREYLVSQSRYFVKLFKMLKNDNSPINIEIPSPETFEPLLEYLYTGNGDKWYDTITLENYEEVYENIKYLGLKLDVKKIWLDFYNSQVGISE